MSLRPSRVLRIFWRQDMTAYVPCPLPAGLVNGRFLLRYPAGRQPRHGCDHGAEADPPTSPTSSTLARLPCEDRLTRGSAAPLPSTTWRAVHACDCPSEGDSLTAFTPCCAADVSALLHHVAADTRAAVGAEGGASSPLSSPIPAATAAGVLTVLLDALAEYRDRIAGSEALQTGIPISHVHASLQRGEQWVTIARDLLTSGPVDLGWATAALVRAEADRIRASCSEQQGDLARVALCLSPQSFSTESGLQLLATALVSQSYQHVVWCPSPGAALPAMWLMHALCERLSRLHECDIKNSLNDSSEESGVQALASSFSIMLAGDHEVHLLPACWSALRAVHARREGGRGAGGLRVHVLTHGLTPAAAAPLSRAAAQLHARDTRAWRGPADARATVVADTSVPAQMEVLHVGLSTCGAGLVTVPPGGSLDVAAVAVCVRDHALLPSCARGMGVDGGNLQEMAAVFTVHPTGARRTPLVFVPTSSPAAPSSLPVSSSSAPVDLSLLRELVTHTLGRDLRQGHSLDHSRRLGPLSSPAHLQAARDVVLAAARGGTCDPSTGRRHSEGAAVLWRQVCGGFELPLTAARAGGFYFVPALFHVRLRDVLDSMDAWAVEEAVRVVCASVCELTEPLERVHGGTAGACVFICGYDPDVCAADAMAAGIARSAMNTMTAHEFSSAGAPLGTCDSPLSAVRPFAELNARLWAVPPAQGPHSRTTEPSRLCDDTAEAEARFRRDWMALVAAMPPAPDEPPSFFSRYLYTWLGPYLELAYHERLTEADFPAPRRVHRARVCGARVSAAFRDGEVRRGREAWATAVAAISPVSAASAVPRVAEPAVMADPPKPATATAATAATAAVGEVVFRGEPLVRGRLRWVGCLRACDDPQRLYAGVEWAAGGPVPSYRRGTGPGGVDLLHDGCVHGERLFYPSRESAGAPRCSCERVEDVELVGAGGGEGAPRPRPASFARVLVRELWDDLSAIAPPAAYFSICQVCNPILLRNFVGFLSSSRRVEGVSRGVITCLVLATMKLTAPVAAKKQVHRAERVAALFQSATLASVFEKCLSIAPSARADPDMSAGRILTMASSDVENIRQMPENIMYVFLAPFEVTFGLCYLFYIVGWSALAGLGMLVLTLLLQSYVVHLQDEIQSRLSVCMDRRLRRTNEMLSGIRIVKTMGWEQKFVDAIEEEARAEEQMERRKLQIITALVWMVVQGGTVGVIVTTLVAYVLSGHTLTANVAFPVLSILSTIDFPCMMIPESLTSLIKFLVSCRRVSRFLECPDQSMTVRDVREIFSEADRDTPAIVLRRATIVAWVVERLGARPRLPSAAGPLARVADAVCRLLGRRRRSPVEEEWVSDPSLCSGAAAEGVPAGHATDAASAEASVEADGGAGPVAHTMAARPLLHDLNLRIPAGKLTVIIGPTGSGKSSVLGAVLGALGVSAAEAAGGGGVWASQDLAYVPQQPWMMQDSVRANITFFEDAAAAEDGRPSHGSARAGGPPLPVVCSPMWRRRGRDGRPLVRAPPPTPARLAQEARLWRALRCCQLDADMRDLADGVDTEIGEKGINLSGGQKARVGLARAVYADRAVYLLDDPLSAVDVHVGRRLVKDVLLGALAGKTRVLVTHQVSVLPHADVVVVMSGGRVEFSGSYDEYMASPVRQALETDLEREERERAKAAGAAGAGPLLLEDPSLVSSPVTCGPPAAGLPPAATPPAPSSSSSDDDDDNDDKDKAEGGPGSGDQAAGGAGGDKETVTKLMTDEEKESGHVPLFVYRRFLQAGGGVALFTGIVFMYTVSILLVFAASTWLSLWSTRAGGLTEKQYLLTYVGINVAMVLLYPLQIIALYVFVRHACGRLHASLLYAAATARVAFFDCTPLGRIVNRFSKDINLLDDHMTQALVLLIDISHYVVASLLLSIISAPLVTPFVVVAAVVFYYLFRYYSTIIREIRRRTSIAQSPMFSLLEEVTAGRESIDAYGKASVLFEQALARLDKLYSARYTEKVVTMWLAVRIEFLSSGVMIAVTLAGLYEKIWSPLDVLPAYRVSLLSLSLTMSFNLFWVLSAIIAFAADVEANMNSAQRILHYVDTIPREELGLRPPRGDPSALMVMTPDGEKADGGVSVVVEGEPTPERGAGDAGGGAGSLEFRHVDLRYRAGLPLVLRNVSFRIAPKEKIGVVGRTGSGKSTLLQTFMRLVEVSGGTMLVDGVPAGELRLPELRRLFALIPQDPVLFNGTVRSNVDPFHESTDAEVQRALRLVGLRRDSADPSMPSEDIALDAAVSEGGSNFSVGQRQLLCLARALLKKGSEFILMDEATANIDMALDRQIQQVVREQFREYTVITIAHRLHTVAGCDRVFVMDRGELVEQGSPRALASDPSSVFHHMVLRSAAGQRQRHSPEGPSGSACGQAVGSPTSSRSERERRALEEFLHECQPA